MTNEKPVNLDETEDLQVYSLSEVSRKIGHWYQESKLQDSKYVYFSTYR